MNFCKQRKEGYVDFSKKPLRKELYLRDDIHPEPDILMRLCFQEKQVQPAAYSEEAIHIKRNKNNFKILRMNLFGEEKHPVK